MINLPMNLQFFAEDPAGDPADGNAAPVKDGGNGNAGQNSGGITYTQEQLDSMVASRTERAEKAALKSFFEQRGMSEEEITKAISDYKEAKQSQQPDVSAIQQEAEQAKAQVQKVEIEKQAIIEGVGMGLDVKTVSYVLKMADLSAATKDGAVDPEGIKAAIEKVLEDIPALKPAQKQVKGGFKVGAVSDPVNNENKGVPTIKEALAARFSQ